MGKKKTELITKESAAVVTAAPAGPARGFEAGIDRDDLIIPRAKLIQALSPEMIEGLENIKVGSIINSLTKEILPAEFIPIFMFKTFIRFNPRSKEDPNFDSAIEPGGVIWKSQDPRDPKVQEFTKFGENGERPIATTFLNFFSYFPGCGMPIIVSFSKTSYRAGRQLLSLAKFAGGDMFSRRYRLVSQMESNDIATFAVLKVMPAGLANPEEYHVGEQWWKEFSVRVNDIQVHEQEAVEDEGGIA